MSVELLAAQPVAGGVCLRFKAHSQDEFTSMCLQIKALGTWDRAWQPHAFANKGGWWLSTSAWQRLGPLFRNYQEMRRRIEEEATSSSAPPRPVPPQVEQAFAVLHLRTAAPGWVIQAVYRVLAKRAHPDAGGSHEAMKAINLAYEQALAWAEQQAA